MNINHLFCKRMLLVCAALLVSAALLVMLFVIPAVRSDSFPGAATGAAVPAFWVAIVLYLLSAVTCVVIAIASKERSRTSTSILVALGLVDLVLGITLATGAAAYRSHGPSMLNASTLLYVCTAMVSLAGVLVVAVAFLRPKGP
jgi:hypothetical protein